MFHLCFHEFSIYASSVFDPFSTHFSMRDTSIFHQSAIHVSINCPSMTVPHTRAAIFAPFANPFAILCPFYAIQLPYISHDFCAQFPHVCIFFFSVLHLPQFSIIFQHSPHHLHHLHHLHQCLPRMWMMQVMPGMLSTMGTPQRMLVFLTQRGNHQSPERIRKSFAP